MSHIDSVQSLKLSNFACDNFYIGNLFIANVILKCQHLENLRTEFNEILENNVSDVKP